MFYSVTRISKKNHYETHVCLKILDFHEYANNVKY